jgi:hypothetical protein
MSTLYLLSVSLFLLGSAFAEDIEIGAPFAELHAASPEGGELYKEEPVPHQDSASVSYPSETPASFKYTTDNKQPLEKEPGSNVRRYSTKPSQAIKEQDPVADSKYQKRVQKSPSSRLRLPTVSAAKTPSACSEDAAPEVEQQQTKRAALASPSSQATPKQQGNRSSYDRNIRHQNPSAAQRQAAGQRPISTKQQGAAAKRSSKTKSTHQISSPKERAEAADE